MLQIDTVAELIKIINDADRTFLYGAGQYGRSLLLFLEQYSVYIDAFLTTYANEKEEWRGVKIEDFQNISIRDKDIVIISTGRKNQQEIQSLLEMRDVRNVIRLTDNLWKSIQTRIEYSEISLGVVKKKIQVLIFHRVCYKTDDPWKLEIRPELFEEYMGAIAENYPVLRFEEDWSLVKEPSIVITFDDGYYDNYHYALPVLQKYHIPATIFVSTGNIGSEREFWWDRIGRILPVDQVQDVRQDLLWKTSEEREKAVDKLEQNLRSHINPSPMDRSMNENELKTLVQTGLITIGAHTVTHSMLSALSEQEQLEEIISSKDCLERMIGQQVKVFSYPYGGKGSYDKTTIDILKTGGFIRAATNYVGVVDAECDPYQIPRCGALGNNANEFLDMIKRNWLILE